MYWAAFLFSAPEAFRRRSMHMKRRNEGFSRAKENEVLFIAPIPQQIEASWHETWGPKLAGFPLNIAYVKGLNHKAPSKSQLESVVYWLDLSTYREDSRLREMDYFTKPRNGYSVRVTFEKQTGRWETRKLKGESRICFAFGQTFDSAMLNTTMVGAEADE
jgi:hypothetical protein